MGCLGLIALEEGTEIVRLPSEILVAARIGDNSPKQAVHLVGILSIGFCGLCIEVNYSRVHLSLHGSVVLLNDADAVELGEDGILLFAREEILGPDGATGDAVGSDLYVVGHPDGERLDFILSKVVILTPLGDGVDDFLVSLGAVGQPVVLAEGEDGAVAGSLEVLLVCYEHILNAVPFV